MKKIILASLFAFALSAVSGQPFTIKSVDGTATCPFGDLPYRVFFPQELTDTACVVHVSRGGNGLGDDRGQLLAYVNYLVEAGYVVAQVDHRFAGNDVPNIARLRGEEIGCISQKVAENAVVPDSFNGFWDGNRQGFLGHSGGCMEGLEAAGTGMAHGNYFVPEIKAVFGLSPAGFMPDQFGIEQPPSGFGNIGSTAIFVVIGEQEKDVNGASVFMATDWRLQAYEAMTDEAPRFEAFFKGANTAHNDIAGQNTDIQTYNQANALAFFDRFVKQKPGITDIGQRALPPANELVFSQKGPTVATDILLNHDIKSFSFFPNPATGTQIAVRFSLAKTEQLRFDLYDARGVLVQNLLDDWLPEGNHELSITLPDYAEPGGYFLTIRMDDSIISEKLFRYR